MTCFAELHHLVHSFVLLKPLSNQLLVQLPTFLKLISSIYLTFSSSSSGQGRLRVPRAGGKAFSEATSMYMYVPPQG